MRKKTLDGSEREALVREPRRRHRQHAAHGGGQRAGRGVAGRGRGRGHRGRARAAPAPPYGRGHAGDAFTITGSLPCHAAHTSGSVAGVNAHGGPGRRGVLRRQG